MESTAASNLLGYDTIDTPLDIQGQQLRITRIADLDVLVDRLDPITFAEDERLPYWAELWPSAVALAHYLRQHLEVGGRRVLELGCGLGLVGIMAARQGARVLCTDYEAEALRFARHNAGRNGCRQVRFRLLDWRRPTLRRRYDYILASDVVYEERAFRPLATLLQRYLSRGGSAVFAEPGRPQSRPFFSLLQQRSFICRREVQAVEWEGEQQITIYTIRFQDRGAGPRPPRPGTGNPAAAAAHRHAHEDRLWTT